MFGLFKKSSLLDEASIDWMYKVFDWAARNLDGDYYLHETVLVTPTNEHFPGSESSVEGMARLIFSQVQKYAGLQNWLFRLVNGEQHCDIEAPVLRLNGSVRGDKAPSVQLAEEDMPVVAYYPHQLDAPDVLIGSYAHVLAHYLGTTSREAPPGGEQNWPQITELLGVFLGFGIIMANTADTAKIRSCGSCSGPAVERANYLSQDDLTYALAIFCQQKSIPLKQAQRFLKKNLQPFFKKACKDVAQRQAA